MRKKTLLSATAVALLAMSFPIQSNWLEVIGCRQASAQEEDPEITAEAKKHYKLGQDAYTDGKYDLAIKELKRAYVLKRIPAILVNIAMTYRKTKDYEMAIYFYKKFLADVPADDKQRPSIEAAIGEVEKERTAASQPQLAPAKPAVELAKPAVEAAKPAVEAVKAVEPAKSAVDAAKPVADAAKPIADAAKPVADAATAGAPAQAPAPEKAASEWAHTPVDAAPPGQPVDIRVQMPVMKGVKVKVFFRKEGQANFDSLELKRRGNEKVARIPGDVAQGKAFQYYIEAKDQAGTVVKAIGNELSPNLVLLDPTARPQMIGAEMQADAQDDEELAKRTKAGPTRDIENEQATFDLGSQERAMAKLRQQMKDRDRGKSKGKALLGPAGWGGGVMALVGLGGLGAGFGMLGLASQNSALVSGDSACDVKVKFNGIPECPHFGPNENPDFSKTLKPATSDYERKGQLYDKVGIAMTTVGGVLLAGGGALLTYDLIKRYGKEKPAAPKTRKVKKVIEVEEPATSWLIAPVVSSDTVGVVSLFNY
jgi:tetratricopeptide (TPR) repeat protein